MRELKGLVRFLVFLFAPFALIFAGAGLVSWGFGNELEWLGWTGVVLIGVGLLWGLIVLLISIGYTGMLD